MTNTQENVPDVGFSNIRELTIPQGIPLSGGQVSADCSEKCYEWPGCDCWPEESNAYNLGLMMSRLFSNPGGGS
jgi:hypothetical protein